MIHNVYTKRWLFDKITAHKGFIQPNVVDQNTGDIFYGIFIKQDICGIVI